MGNLYESAKQDDRVYDKGGKLLKDELHYYYYDAKGNLVFKEYKKTEHPQVVEKKDIQNRFKIKLQGSGIGYQYIWSVSGTLQEVISPMGNQVQFYYDPLGRRIAKISKGQTTRWVWDGNVPLYEWKHKEIYPLPMVVNEVGKLTKATEPTENMITWLYEVNSFVPCGKTVDGESFSIVTDYLGTPEYMYNAKGELVWHATLDIYGRITVKKGGKYDCSFRYQGQYEDRETGGLYYNRFRYYDPKMGMYICQDPIGIEGGIALYGYVHDINNWIDYLGLTGTPSAKAKAKEAAKNLRTQYRKGLINDLPTATTAVVNKRTGEVFIGNSGVKPMVTNTTLLQEMPKVSLEK